MTDKPRLEAHASIDGKLISQVELRHVRLSCVELVVDRRHTLGVIGVIRLSASAPAATIGGLGAALPVLLQAVGGRSGFAPAVSEPLLVVEGVSQRAPDRGRFIGRDGSEGRLKHDIR